MPALSPEEVKLKRLIQEVLVRNGVLKTKSEREWNVYCSRRILRDFVNMMRQGRKDARSGREKPSPPRAASRPAPQSRGGSSGRRRT